MTNPQPYIHVYQKPKLGSGFIRRYPAANYKHRILAMGGFDTASCKIPCSRFEGEAIFEQYVGNRAAFYMDNPFDPIFEGLITRVTFTTPGAVLTRSMDGMGNRTAVNTGVDASAAPLVLTTVNNTVSQATYGIITRTLRAARRHSTGGAGTYTTSLAARELNDIAYPLVSVAVNDSVVDSIISLEVSGFFHTFDWEDNNQDGNRAFRNGTTGWIDAFLTFHPNGTTFISADTRDLTNNAQTYTVNPGATAGQSIWKFMQMLAECGNNAQSWVVGVGAYDWNTGSRRLYFRPADTTNKYLYYVNRPGKFYSLTNTPIEPWYARPDGVVLVADAIVGWQSDGTSIDPREAYLSVIEYEADTGKISWQSQDNIQILGALQVDKWHTMSDMRYGQRANDAQM